MALVLLLGAGLRVGLGQPRARPRWPAPETAACLSLAVLYRLPALVEPWGWVNRDGAYGAFVALHLLQGQRPAPIFTEGASYQGTLKGHLAALLAVLTPARDLSLLMMLASLLLYAVFVAATMALARRAGGRAAALVAGVYLAVSPRFLTVFSLNCVGQYVDVLALGGLALALLARLLHDGRMGASARGAYLGIGLLLGAAFWQQPVALAYVITVGLVLAMRRETWRDPWVLLVLAGLAVGTLPVLIWNAQHAWASGEVLGRDADDLQAQIDALPLLVQRTVSISFPILVGLSPNLPWARPGLQALAAAIIPAALAGVLVLRGREIAASLRAARPIPALIAPVLALANLGLFWSVAAGHVYWRPRYLFPLLAATAVHLGLLAAWGWGRRAARPAVLGAAACLLALNASGSAPRLRESAAVAEPYRELVRSLTAKGIRTGYADFSLAAPVTMFTAERIVLSPALGPTPAYESEAQARRVREEGPEAYVLLPDDDIKRFAHLLRSAGVRFAFDPRPFPVFYAFSRRVALEEVISFRAEKPERPPPPE